MGEVASQVCRTEYLLPTGERITVGEHPEGTEYRVEMHDREFGAWDSNWNREAAYEAALDAVQSQK